MEKTVRENPTMKVMDIREKVTRKWNVGILRNMAFRAKGIAKDKVEGSFQDQHFISYRPIIGLDGCFLKGKYGGELLTTVGRDGNEQMLPIAYAIVEVLIEDLGGEAVCASCTFISDQQKGLLPAIQDLLPGAATTTYPQQWEAEMRKIKDINLDAFKHLIAILPRFWSRSRFTSRSQCDTLVNNMCEGFNSVLVHSRSKPTISMLEDIRIYIMKRWATNRTKMSSYQGSVCPKVFNRFQNESWLTRYWLPRWSREKLFEVKHISQFGEQFVVNVDNMDCTCRKWTISGIPCTHAITTMKFLNINAEDYIGHWFRKSTYEETYNPIIYPIKGQNVWDVTPYSNVLPPKKRTMPGRPKKKRRLEDWELKKNDSELRKGGHRKKCSIYTEIGHNKKGCPQRPQTVQVPTAQSTQQTEVSQPPSTDLPITQEDTMLPTAQFHEQPQPTQPSATHVPITQDAPSSQCRDE
ncbi:hypothetical protein V8G54_003968 [Vigna mungo]|uniref:SWIM-type domain-containing protein n=1 Tax=Vigna mungo TaxID=3915 RepID=A0AAQ3PDW9_VIGMU